MRLLVTGTQGQITRSLAARGAAQGVEIALLGRPELDLADSASIRRAFDGQNADAIINAAAYTAVDKAEQEEELATAINGVGAGVVASVAAERGIPFLHISTDYVFDGALDRPYRENDPTGPIGAYGRSKLAGEQAVLAANPHAVILRTAWVYAPFGANFVRTMLRLGETRDEISVVADQRGAPTYAPDIADALIAIARKRIAQPQDGSLGGVFHMTGSGEAVWADFADEIFAAATQFGRKPVAVRRITTADYPTPARRPGNSRLDCGKLRAAYGVELPDWRASTRNCVERLLAPVAQSQDITA